jgi:hypothetical protein
MASERILELAVQCDAIIVTHNKRDFDAALQFAVEIMSPAEVLKTLRGAAASGTGETRRSGQVSGYS